MSTTRLFRLLCLVPGALVFAEQNAIPEPLPSTRYDKLLEESPFAVATPTAPVAEPEKPWAENLSLGPVARYTSNGKERDFAIIKRRGDLTGSFTLDGTGPGPEGIELVKIEWSENPAKTSVVVKKGNEFATLKPNEADFTNPPPATPPAGARQPGSNPLQINNPAAPIRKTPAPASTQVPRPTAVGPAANTATANPPAAAGTAPGTERKRIRVIPSQPAAR